MPVTGFNHYNLRAPRKVLAELKEFYCNVIGLQEGARPPFRSFGYWLYAAEQAVLHLTEARADEFRATDVATTFDHAAFTCTNLPEMEARLIRRHLKYERNTVPATGEQQLFFRDPAGNGVELNFAEPSVR